MLGEELVSAIGFQECLLGFLAVLGLGCLAYHYLASSAGSSWPRKSKNNARSEAILQDFERRYKEGKITLAQYEDVLKRHFDK